MSNGALEASKVLLPTANGTQIRQHLRRGFRGRRRRVVATLIAMTVESALTLVPPIAIGQITEDAVTGRSTRALLAPVVLLVAAAAATAAATWIAGVMLAKTVFPYLAELREEVLTAALSLPLEAVEAGGIGDLVSRVSGDVEAVTDAADFALGSFIGAVLTIFATLVGLASLDWRLALAGLVAVPIQIRTLRWYLSESRPIYAAGRVAEGRRTGALLGAFAALPTLRAFGIGEHQRRRVEAASEEAMSYEFRATRAATRFYGRLNVAELLGLGAILAVGFGLVRHGSVSVGAATTAALFFAALFDPINTALGVFDSVQQAGAGLARLVGITVSAPMIEALAAPPAGALVASGLRFGYGDGPEVLHGIDTQLEPGRHIAVVGRSGSGKSTLAMLLAGVRRPSGGDVTLGGVALSSIEPTGRHRSIALLTQETHVFAGTVADNLRLVAPEADDHQLTAALASVGADDWVEALPDGLDTLVGAGGHVLPASQAQHLALARVALLDPPFVILDEATAEAGSDTARLLDHAAARAIAGKGALVIAHRLGQAATADEIAVMDGGRIVERGTQPQLVAAGGSYAALWSAWIADSSAIE